MIPTPTPAIPNTYVNVLGLTLRNSLQIFDVPVISVMRALRRLVPEDQDGLYHVVNRVVERRKIFGEAEKTHFLGIVRAYAEFSGIQVVAWCLMGNHFHLLLRVASIRRNPPASLPEEEILRRMSLICSPREMREARTWLAGCSTPGARSAFLVRFTRRMGNLSLFMKSVKQKFTQWFNRRENRTGTLWEERFRSVVIDAGEASGGLGHKARIVAAYIDLNPVRAGLVGDPKDFPWSGYARAVAGEAASMAGLQCLWGTEKPALEVLAAHEKYLAEVEEMVRGQTIDPWVENTVFRGR